jgi:hypothetical protein
LRKSVVSLQSSSGRPWSIAHVQPASPDWIVYAAVLVFGCAGALFTFELAFPNLAWNKVRKRWLRAAAGRADTTGSSVERQPTGSREGAAPAPAAKEQAADGKGQEAPRPKFYDVRWR